MMWFGMLPIVCCARCGLRGIPLTLASCPRCGAVYGWAQIDPAALGVFMVALWDEQQRMGVQQRTAEPLISQVYRFNVQRDPIGERAEFVEQQYRAGRLRLY